mmetsp:Transcript_17378/g.43282  ORF Transcript_17378/g.43282 Transcript_17378/m.43282 type:complete len:222 (+) Transcript_17378:760-1425(+)
MHSLLNRGSGVDFENVDRCDLDAPVESNLADLPLNLAVDFLTRCKGVIEPHITNDRTEGGLHKLFNAVRQVIGLVHSADGVSDLVHEHGMDGDLDVIASDNRLEGVVHAVFTKVNPGHHLLLVVHLYFAVPVQMGLCASPNHRPRSLSKRGQKVKTGLELPFKSPPSFHHDSGSLLYHDNASEALNQHHEEGDEHESAEYDNRSQSGRVHTFTLYSYSAEM